MKLPLDVATVFVVGISKGIYRGWYGVNMGGWHKIDRWLRVIEMWGIKFGGLKGSLKKIKWGDWETGKEG